ncbi:MAG: chlorite dismutase family protein [Caldilineaceae bacterium]|nr:chlorite dismutase family protein [Caldilinea sp.]MCB0066104.1 chlorite dismutase family protein [Caldilineaceae bacterium]MCB0136886.1 chlorite dismutase family protein [Caldilineaceae bacterium]
MSHPFATTEGLDISEQGRTADGEVVRLDRRLFMQLYAFGECYRTDDIVESLAERSFGSVLYADANDPLGIALLTFTEDPNFFVNELRDYLRLPPFAGIEPKPEYTMMGRTYALGNEAELERSLITRPRQKVCDPAMPWAIWYPLRRAGTFEQLSAQEQRTILMEHGGIGHAYGRAGYGTDIRLACHGLDKNDNDFVVGLLGPELYPLSSIVQRMRKTKQTSLHLERLGPFFVGKAIWQSEGVTA